MILYGRNMSPFVRRLAITCHYQGRDIERKKLTVAGEDHDFLKSINPVGRVPILVLDDGTALSESYAIGDWLDETTPNGVRMLPEKGVERRDVLQLLSLANGTADKAVGLVYEKNRRPSEFQWPEWQQRIIGQIKGGLSALDSQLPKAWPDIPNAGILAAVITYQFIQASNPDLLEGDYDKLKSLSDQALKLDIFQSTMPEV